MFTFDLWWGLYKERLREADLDDEPAEDPKGGNSLFLTDVCNSEALFEGAPQAKEDLEDSAIIL